jgi:hypothetical protein
MSQVKPSPKQLREKRRFAEAVAFPQSINNNPKKKAAYKVAEGLGKMSEMEFSESGELIEFYDWSNSF